MPDLARLEEELRTLGSVVVAFSGGADSAFLASMATRTLGAEHVHCVTAVSQLARGVPSETTAHALATEWGLRWTEVETDELSHDAYVANDGERCFWCKTSLMDALVPIATAEQSTVVLGVNVDDLGDHRPGQRAAAERGARFPLVEAGFTKADVRSASRELGLRTWDKPAAACLASRVPYGTPVTIAVLSKVERAEAALRALGFAELRVRHYDKVARIELPVDALARAVDRRVEIIEAVKGAGYSWVTLDLEGLRSGNLNALL